MPPRPPLLPRRSPQRPVAVLAPWSPRRPDMNDGYRAALVAYLVKSGGEGRFLIEPANDNGDGRVLVVPEVSELVELFLFEHPLPPDFSMKEFFGVVRSVMRRAA